MQFQKVTLAEFRFKKVTRRSPVKEKAPTETL